MIIDLTHTITPDMPMYPGSAAPSMTPTGSLTRTGYREIGRASCRERV